MFHWLPHRIEAHVRICVFALLIERVAELVCSQSWLRIRRALDALQATEFHTSTQSFFRMNEVSQPLRQLFKSLAIPLPKRVLGARSQFLGKSGPISETYSELSLDILSQSRHATRGITIVFQRGRHERVGVDCN